MKNIIALVLIITTVGLAGCATTNTPVYIKSVKPQTQRFYAGHAATIAAVKLALQDLGWEVEQEADPQVYEVDSLLSAKEQILLITKLRETRFFLGTRYARMNIYVWSRDEVSEVEVRYAVTTDLFLIRPRSYGNKNMARRLFERITQHLAEP